MNKIIIFAMTLVLSLAIKVVKADFIFGDPIHIETPVNSSAGEGSPSISADRLSLYFTSLRLGGYGVADIWVSTRATVSDAWGEPVNLGPAVNSYAWDGELSISSDGLSLYFSSERFGGQGMADIWVTTRATTSDPWEEAVNLGPIINSPFDDVDVLISVDGLSLYIESFREGGHGNTDIWVTKRETLSDPWRELENLGSTVNTGASDGAPGISADDRVLFFSDFWGPRSNGQGGSDIWMTMRTTTSDPWGEPINLGPTVNSSANDQGPNISVDGSTLYFFSTRPGGSGDFDLWQVSINPIVDLNSDGIVNADDMVIMVDSWGTDSSLCDIGPMPWGDGVVDVEDLKVLAEHLFEDYRLIAQWTLDEEEGIIAYDSVGKYDAELRGGPTWQPTSGKEGGALEFDGVDDYVSIPFILVPSEESVSAFAWIKGGAPGQVIISQRNTVVNNATKLGNSWLWADSSYGRLITRLMHPPFDPLMSESVITDGQWHHVGLVYDHIGLRRYLYVDGAKVAQDTTNAGGVGLESGLYLGAGESLIPNSFFSGLIDDVRIYNSVLSPEEIAALAQ